MALVASLVVERECLRGGGIDRWKAAVLLLKSSCPFFSTPLLVIVLGKTPSLHATLPLLLLTIPHTTHQARAPSMPARATPRRR